MGGSPPKDQITKKVNKHKTNQLQREGCDKRGRETERDNAQHNEKLQCEHTHVTSCQLKKKRPLAVSSVFVAFLASVTRYLTKSDLREDRRYIVHHGEEGMAAGKRGLTTWHLQSGTVVRTWGRTINLKDLPAGTSSSSEYLPLKVSITLPKTVTSSRI